MPREDFDKLEDLGHGVAIQRMFLDGHLEGLAYFHERCTYGEGQSYIPLKPHNKEGWVVESENPLTLSPSLLCRSCGFHGFIKQGRWVPA
jgi:hypothetical protein